MRQFIVVVALTLVLCCTVAGHTGGKPSEYQLKAAYLYNFAKFIRWPDSAFSDQNTPLVIGVLGENPFEGKLAPLTLRSVRNRPIKIRYFKTLKDVQTCHLLYISSSGATETKSVINGLGTRPIITVGDSKKFAVHGGGIQFVTNRGRLRFIINLKAAKNSRVKIEAQLLSLALEVLGVEK